MSINFLVKSSCLELRDSGGMEAKFSQSFLFSTWIASEKIVRKPSSSLWSSWRCKEQHRLQFHISSHLLHRRNVTRHGPVGLEASCFHQRFAASLLESGDLPASVDEAMILKTKLEEIEPYLNGRCIYLVGMMGSGKTTIGRILSEALRYSFFDSDTLIEQAAGGASVAEIFNLYGERFFRDNETEVLQNLSLMHRLVVSTGGGAVVRPINWKYMQKGISVWLDVPLEALARRIAAVGTESRPLLHIETSDAYTKALMRLSTLLEERGESYANANARVSLENIAGKLGYMDVCNLTPAAIAIEVLMQIERFLREG